MKSFNKKTFITIFFCIPIQLYQEAENILIESKDIIQELIGYKGQLDKLFFR